MSAYKALRDVSNNFENELRQLSSQLFCAKVGEKFEDSLVNKMRDMKLFSSKLKLLRAKPLSLTPQIREQPLDNTLREYEDTVQWKLIEQMTVKSLTQAHAVKALITTPDKHLDPGLIERKEAIIECLSTFQQKESELHHLDTVLKEKEAEHAALRVEWDTLVGNLRDTITDGERIASDGNRGPLYSSLKKLVDKLEAMRWLVGRLACSRGGPGRYDWLADPHRRLSALALTRTHNTVDTFTQDE